MGNDVRGIISFQDGDTEWRLQMTANAFCELEDVTQMGSMEYVEKLQRDFERGAVHFKDVRLLFWAALTEHHEGIKPGEAGRVMGRVGSLTDAMDLLQRAVIAGLGQDDTKDEDAPGNPPEAPV